jgi:hypothetical protein
MNYSEDQYDEFSTHMHEKFPEMFSRPYGGIAVGAGWWPVIESLCNQIQGHIKNINERRDRLLENNPWKHKIPETVPQVYVAQIKEKFGGLRFYYDGGDDVIDGMVRMAESWAACSCEKCGKPGEIRSGGWIRTLCDEHEAEYQRRQQEREDASALR